MIHTGEASGTDSDSDQSAIGVISQPKEPKRTKFAGTKRVEDELLSRSLNQVSVVDVKCCTGTAKQKWAVYRANQPKQDLLCLGCDYSDKGWSWTEPMGPQYLKRALCEDRDEGDKAALEVTTELIAAELGGHKESAIQVCGNTSMCASTTVRILRVPCGYPRHRVEHADHTYQIDECLNIAVDILG